MKKYFVLLILAALMASCEKELDFKYHDIEPVLVIESRLSQDGAWADISFTTPMNEPIPPLKPMDADVSITDLTTGDEFMLKADESGRFVSVMQPNYWHEYRLKVAKGGNRYESVSKMYPAVEIVDLKFEWIKMPYDMVALLEISFAELEDRDACYWTRVYKNGEPYKWALSHGSGAVDGVLTQSMFTTRQNPDDPDDSSVLNEGDVLDVAVSAISLEMYDYLTAIQSDSNGPRMFKGDYCLGYFLASAEARGSIAFTPLK